MSAKTSCSSAGASAVLTLVLAAALVACKGAADPVPTNQMPATPKAEVISAPVEAASLTTRIRYPTRVWWFKQGCHVGPLTLLHILDAETMKPVRMLDDGQPEVFLSVRNCPRHGHGGRPHLQYVGFFSSEIVEVEFDREVHPNRGPDMMLNMVLRRLNSTQSVIVQSGCCGGEPEWGAKELNDVVDPLRDALNILWPYERRDGMYEHLCLPLMHPVLVLNPGTRVPRWVKLYGARLTQPIPGIRCTEDTTKVVNDVVHLGSHLGDGTVMAFTSGSRGEQVAFRIDLQTGMPIGQLPVGIKVFDFAEVKAFRDDFRQQFGCSNAPVPPMGLRDGSCLELKAQYEKAVVAHFFK